MKHKPLLISALLIALGTTTACSAEPNNTSSAKDKSAMTTLPKAVNDLMSIDHTVGSGAEALPLNNVVVHYTGWLYDPSKPEGHGDKFDSSKDRGEPFEFLLGGGQVIRGWDEGVNGMKVGGKRTLIIPAHMGYGARGAGGVIPPYATLVFDVELLDVR